MVDILIADSQRIVCKGLRAVLEQDPNLRVIGEAYDGSALLALHSQLEPDLTITEINLPVTNGIAVSRQITQIKPGSKILIFTSLLDDRDIVAAANAGVSGYISKNISEESLLEAVRAIACGHSVFDSEVMSRICGRYRHISSLPYPDSSSSDCLSPRENEVLSLMCQGLRNGAIAKELFVSENTIKTHISHVLKKLGAKTRTEAMAFVVNSNISQ